MVRRHDIPIEHFDFRYINDCNDVEELESIYKTLRTRENGYYEALESCCEDRIKLLNPKSKTLIRDNVVGQISSLPKSEQQEIAEQLNRWRTSQEGKGSVSAEETQPIREIRQFTKQEAKFTNQIKLDGRCESPTSTEGAKISQDHKTKGNEAFRCGEYEEALEYYSASLQCHVSEGVANNRGLTYMKLGRFSEAVPDFERAISLNRKNTRAMVRMAKCLGELGNHGRAHSVLAEVVAISPGDVEANTLMRECESKISGKKAGKKLKISEKYENIPALTQEIPIQAIEVEDCGGNFPNTLKRVEALENSNDYDAAIDILSWLAGNLVNRGEYGTLLKKLLRQRSAGFYKTNKLWRAISDLTFLITKFGGDSELHLERAKCFEKMEKYLLSYSDLQTAESLSTSAGNMKPHLESVRGQLNTIYGGNWKIENNFSEQIEEKIRKNLSFPSAVPGIVREIYNQLKSAGNAHFQEKEYSKSRQFYSECVALETGDPSAELNIALCCLRTAEYSRVVDHCNSVLSRNGGNIKALYRRALGFKGLGEFGRALEDLDGIAREGKGNADVVAERNEVLRMIRREFRRIEIRVVEEFDSALVISD